ncbi:MAG TPA: 50S ribosomal protein L25 [Clostridiales bacterium]|nr:50S ribosomal protein L25 [Clostridiales bacterium]
MDVLKAEYRDTKVKAKKLRKMGFVPCTIYGGDLKESVHIQIPFPDINRFVSRKLKGSTLTIDLGDKQYNVLYKNISRSAPNLEIEHLEFQHLIADEPVNSVMQVVLLNKDKNPNLIQLHIEEIPYNALPSHLMESVTIDLDRMGPGTVVKVEDLDIVNNPNIKLLIPADTVILSVSEPNKASGDEQTAEAAAAE